MLLMSDPKRRIQTLEFISTYLCLMICDICLQAEEIELYLFVRIHI